MLEDRFNEVYSKFKLHFYRETFARFQNREEDYNYVQETIDSRLNSSERSEYNPADSDDFDFANRPGMEPEPDFLHD